MKNRIEQKFFELSKKQTKALSCFITSGDPTEKIFEKILFSLPHYGADIIEVGLPFSDPMADGPTIQKSSQRAIKSGININKTLKIISKFRENDLQTPIILMGYFNPIFQYGLNNFFSHGKRAGIDGLIIVDLPPEEDEEFYIEAERNKLSVIRLVTPTTDEKRLNKILFNATGFVYYVSITGITGTQAPNVANVSINLKKITTVTDLPVVIGFGIRSPSQASSMANISDGIVVGSAVVDLIKSSLDNDDNPTKQTLNSCLDFISKVSENVKHN